jgi:hypothetical protein
MRNRSVRHILRLGPLLWDICVSSVGCFVFTSGFRSFAMEKEGSETGILFAPSVRPASRWRISPPPCFYPASVTSEALATIRALGR